jgi:hypothetical protein
MDLEQRFIEASYFDVDEWFSEKIRELPDDVRTEIIYDIAGVVEYLPKNDVMYQQLYGVAYCVDLFYVLEYFKEDGEYPLITDIDIIELDEYLDAVIENKTIKSYYEQRT